MRNCRFHDRAGMQPNRTPTRRLYEAVVRMFSSEISSTAELSFKLAFRVEASSRLNIVEQKYGILFKCVVFDVFDR